MLLLILDFPQCRYSFGKPSTVRVEWYPHVSRKSQRGRLQGPLFGDFFDFFFDRDLGKCTITQKVIRRSECGSHRRTRDISGYARN